MLSLPQTTRLTAILWTKSFCRWPASTTALVAENVKDFDRLVRQRAESGTHHAGVIFTSPATLSQG